ncbi:MAG: tetratricopeptide repeat protein [Desulfobacterales bacterium]|uniref:Tetratricopeptide repeat protein n=1 Tax=Candidatus Desulfatibia vada TaxID=2841696 RepID=A0A8J6TTA9_9BACT|nr:tetratricopeptide repeat protein [Candidatus Desulfatibia vada]
MTPDNFHTKIFFNMRSGFLICLFLALATLAVYWQVQNHDFVNFDDDIYVTANRHVQEGLTPESIMWAFTTTYAANWHPLTWISHMLDYEIYGLNPGGHHLTNLLLHLTNTLLLFIILGKMTGALWRSAFVAALFALHPLHVESVAWVSERKDVLSTFWGMLSLLAYHCYVKKPRLSSFFLIIVFFTLGLMAKPMLVTLPFVLLLLDYWPLKRYQCNADRQREGEDKRFLASGDIFKLIWEKVPLFILVVISSILTFMAQSGMGAVRSLEVFSLKVRVANAFVSYVSYVVKAIWPVNLGVFYPHIGELLPWWQAVGSAVLIAAVCFWAVRMSKKHPYVLVGVLWYLGTLVPVIGLVQVGKQALADRYTYVPLIGIFIIVAWGVPEILPKWRRRKIWLAVLATASLTILMTLTWHQVRYWKNSIVLFEHSIRVAVNNYQPHWNLGVALAEEGRIDEAINHYLEVLRMKPDHHKAHNNLGIAFIIKGDINGAVAHFQEALRIKPDHENARKNLKKILDNQQKGELLINDHRYFPYKDFF